MSYCPICKSNKVTPLINLRCGNLDGSTLYKSAKIVSCKICGHVYNEISPKEIAGLNNYYNEEYTPVNISSPNKTGDMPGSSSIFSLQRYDNLFKLISSCVNKDSKILDGGCATGGFLYYLSKKGLSKLYGFDMSKKYIDQARKNRIGNVKVGDIESIPFNDHSMDLLVVDQVLEHVTEPIKAFKEAKRVLTSGGFFCISVPDAARYNKKYFFDFYWFLLREHLQHFDLKHLELLAAQEGFELVAYSRSETPMMSEKMLLPALSVAFRISGKNKINISKKHFRLREQVKNYIAKNLKNLSKKKKIINKLIKSKKLVYAWGMGREFMYLYESADLKKCKIAGLIDANPYKQEKYSVGGNKIQDKSILKKASPDSVLVISAVAHTASIKNELKKIGYSGQIVSF